MKTLDIYILIYKNLILPLLLHKDNYFLSSHQFSHENYNKLKKLKKSTIPKLNENQNNKDKFIPEQTTLLHLNETTVEDIFIVEN